jgi:hypothetical protein
MTPSWRPNGKYKASPSVEKELNRGVWLFFGGMVVIAIIAINSGYFFGSIFIGAAALILLMSIRREMRGSEIVVLSVATLILVGVGSLFIIPWDTSSGPGLTNDDRYQRLLNESAFSCQPEHYDEQNCRAQKQGLDAAARWYNEQRR